MDFIERWLGISPDGGNGTLELLVLLVPVVLLLARHRLRRRASRISQSTGRRP